VDLSISTHDQGALSVVRVEGEIDVYTAPSLRERLDALVQAGRVRLIVDLAHVDFLDSTGLGVLVGRLKLVRVHGGSLQLVCVNERVLKVFAITGLEKVFSIYRSVEEAVADAESDDLEAPKAPPSPSADSSPTDSSPADAPPTDAATEGPSPP